MRAQLQAGRLQGYANPKKNPSSPGMRAALESENTVRDLELNNFEPRISSVAEKAETSAALPGEGVVPPHRLHQRVRAGQRHLRTVSGTVVERVAARLHFRLHMEHNGID